ncbi:MAG: imidazolonepropionase [Candidatus Nanopelagicales bacterium]|nr:imidazolonepropionase [Candidatus Nanopelagicales bacterium]
MTPHHSLLLDDIGELVTNDPALAERGAEPDVAALGIVHDAAVVVADGRVAWVGPAAQAPAADERLDCAGGAVLPGFVDSHAHLVFAGERAGEFAARMSGRPYRAGGIGTTVTATRAASDAALRTNLARLVAELHAAGVTTFEVKSGYGLTVADEQRACRLAAEVTDEVTFLGAHVVPAEHARDRAGYLDLLTGPMLAAAAPHARWADVFVERGAFDAVEAHVVLEAAARAGLGLRVHANQLGPGPGAALAAAHGAASADHCTHLRRRDIAALADAGTVATLLPAAELGTRSPFPDARRLLAAGVTVALATDCNPGTAYTTSMPLVIALAVSGMRMTPAEAVRAATAGGATALRRTDVGRIVPGGPADLVLLDAPSHVHLAYRPGVPLLRAVWQGGVRVDRREAP